MCFAGTTVTVSAAVAAGDGVGVLQNELSGKCADLPGFGPGVINGPINQFTCNTTSADNQLFYLDLHAFSPDGHLLYTLRNAKDNLCMDVPGLGAVSAGTKVSEFTCNGTFGDNQLFRLVERPSGWYWFVNYASGLCLDVDGFRSTANDARLTLFVCSDNDDHTWYFQQLP
jgi:hypothetical protein